MAQGQGSTQDLPPAPNPGQDVYLWARRLYNWLLKNRVSGGQGIYTTRTATGITVNAKAGEVQLPPHPFKTTAGPDTENEGKVRVSVAPGAVIYAIGEKDSYGSDPDMHKIIGGSYKVSAANEYIVPTGIYPFEEKVFDDLDKDKTYCVFISVSYQKIFRVSQAGDWDEYKELIVPIEDPGDYFFTTIAYFADGIGMVCKQVDVDEKEITIAPTQNAVGLYPVAIVNVDAGGATEIKQILRSDFHEPFGGHPALFSAE